MNGADADHTTEHVAPSDAWTCLYNESPIDSATGYCADDSHTHCPFCGSCGYIDGCRHLVAAESMDADEGWATAPFEPLPRLAEACSCVWSEEQLREVFGETYPLLVYYVDLREPPDQYGLFRRMVGELTVPVRMIHYNPAASMASSEGDDYYCQFADEARTQIGLIVDRMHVAFKRLDRRHTRDHGDTNQPEGRS